MITVDNLSKQYESLFALRRVDYKFESGHTTGVIGPNGSGKSTLIKCLLGLVKRTSGQISLGGVAIHEDGQYRKSLGYVPQLAKYPQDLTGHDIINMVWKMRMAEPIRKDELIDLLGLKSELGKRTRAMSGGTRQKLSIVIAGMFDPEVLVLDEPSAGLDPVANMRLKSYLHELHKAGRTIIISTHIMSDLDELADDLLLLVEGEVRYKGSIRELKMKTEEPQLERAVAQILQVAA